MHSLLYSLRSLDPRRINTIRFANPDNKLFTIHKTVQFIKLNVELITTHNMIRLFLSHHNTVIKFQYDEYFSSEF